MKKSSNCNFLKEY